MVRTPLAGAVVGLIAASLAWGGAAGADPGQDPGSNRNQPGRQVGTVDPAKLEAKVKAETKELDDAAKAILKDLEATGWSAPPPSAQQAALGPIGPVPTVGMGGLVPNARALAAYIANTYPGVQAIGGVRSDPLPDHPSGHAIDIMTGWDMGLGDVINADVQSQSARFGVKYTLWRVPNHFNHVHVTVF